MPLTDQQHAARLRALRHSHCATCGCARCRWIDQQMEAAGTSPDFHPKATRAWLLEGRLLPDDQGGWVIQSGETITPLGDSLSPWAGHHVVVLIGARPVAQAGGA